MGPAGLFAGVVTQLGGWYSVGCYPCSAMGPFRSGSEVACSGSAPQQEKSVVGAGIQTEKSAMGVVTGTKDKDADKVPLADAARCKVYVCFEGPLGAHLKTELREKIWKDEFVEIFSLLPLE